MQEFDPKEFVEATVAEMRKSIGVEKALVAVSGGVDSTTCALLTHRAIGANFVCVILDDAFMRQGEPEYVAEMLSKPPFNVPIKIVDVRGLFLEAMKGLKDAEEKRKKFRGTFYQALSETAKKNGCRVLVQGTIKADIIETVGGVKTQHNVLQQIGINPMESYGFKVVEPLLPLFKTQVRRVARYFGLPPEFSERQPFPGPGLSVRVVGEIRPDKLETLRKATVIAETGLREHKPGQCFAAIMDNEEVSRIQEVLRASETAARLLNVPSRNVHTHIFREKATGMEGGKRRYGEVVGIDVVTMNGKPHQTSLQNIISLQARMITEKPEISRVLYAIKSLENKKPYIVVLRSVETKDFLTANVSEIPWSTLNRIAQDILETCPNVSTVYYDVTPKPPATIEME